MGRSWQLADSEHRLRRNEDDATLSRRSGARSALSSRTVWDTCTRRTRGDDDGRGALGDGQCY